MILVNGRSSMVAAAAAFFVSPFTVVIGVRLDDDQPLHEKSSASLHQAAAAESIASAKQHPDEQISCDSPPGKALAATKSAQAAQYVASVQQKHVLYNAALQVQDMKAAADHDAFVAKVLAQGYMHDSKVQADIRVQQIENAAPQQISQAEQDAKIEAVKELMPAASEKLNWDLHQAEEVIKMSKGKEAAAAKAIQDSKQQHVSMVGKAEVAAKQAIVDANSAASEEINQAHLHAHTIVREAEAEAQESLKEAHDEKDKKLAAAHRDALYRINSMQMAELARIKQFEASAQQKVVESNQAKIAVEEAAKRKEVSAHLDEMQAWKTAQTTLVKVKASVAENVHKECIASDLLVKMHKEAVDAGVASVQAAADHRVKTATDQAQSKVNARERKAEALLNAAQAKAEATISRAALAERTANDDFKSAQVQAKTEVSKAEVRATLRVQHASDEAAESLAKAKKAANDIAKAKVQKAESIAAARVEGATKAAEEKVSDSKKATDLAIEAAEEAETQIPRVNKMVVQMKEAKVRTEAATEKAFAATQRTIEQKNEALGRIRAIDGTAAAIKNAKDVAEAAEISVKAAAAESVTALAARAESDNLALTDSTDVHQDITQAAVDGMKQGSRQAAMQQAPSLAQEGAGQQRWPTPGQWAHGM